jgi:hypothetical protein
MHEHEESGGSRMLVYLLIAAALAVVGWLVFGRDHFVAHHPTHSDPNVLLVESTNLGDGNIMEVYFDKKRGVTCYRTTRYSNSVALFCFLTGELDIK